MDASRRPLDAISRFCAFARPGNWFVSKLPPLLAIAYIDILRFSIAPGEAARLLVSALFSICCVAIYGHVVNDIFDLDADRLANKTNRLAAMRPARRVLLAVTFLLAGFLPALVIKYPVGAILLLALNYLWPAIYSIPPARLKERGLFGVTCDALGSHITPTLFILALFATAAPGGLTLTALVATLWATVLGLKGILHHQIADRDNDILSGVVTFATQADLATLQRFLTRFNLWVELPVSAFFTLLVFPWCPLAVPAFLLYTGAETVKYQLGFQFALTANPATIRPSVPFINEMFYILWLPMAAAVQLGFEGPGFLYIPLLHSVIFHRPLLQQLGDWRAILRQTGIWRAIFKRLRNWWVKFQSSLTAYLAPAAQQPTPSGIRRAQKRQDVVRLYDDAYAAQYEQKFLNDPLMLSDTTSELDLLRRLLTPEVSWLDVACGTGFFLRHFPETHRAGIDLSPAMLRLARQGNPAIELREHDYRDPIPEWENKWGLVSCMWYAYGFTETIAELDRLIANLWSWTAMNGTCFVPLADPRLMTGVNLPYQALSPNAGRVMITGILWSYIEDDIGAAHAHLLAPNLEFMTELFQQYFERVEILRYPPAFEGWQGRPALLASGKKRHPSKMPPAGPWAVTPGPAGPG
jgi:4-hydroxybenzoate polyprenyltransferase/SAM-dependent methyltransferase